ncbi:MAG: hypothetical protein Q7J68_07530, partial [Thermoplasmata archaeon]|nr:hypothetical protein [Thermoplasmata archaeon]
MGLRDKAKKALEEEVKDILVSEEAPPEEPVAIPEEEVSTPEPEQEEAAPEEDETSEEEPVEDETPKIDISDSIAIEEPTPTPIIKKAEPEKTSDLDEFQKSIEKMKALDRAEKDLKKKLVDTEKERDASAEKVKILETQLKEIDKKQNELDKANSRISELDGMLEKA